MKQLSLAIIIFTLILFFISACSDEKKTNSPNNTEETYTANDSAVVTVNGKALKQDELNKQVNRMLVFLKDTVPAKQIDEFKSHIQGKIINSFITRTLLKAECDRLKIEVTNKEIDDKLNKYMQRLPKDMDLDATLKQADLEMKDLKDNIRLDLQLEKLVALKSKNQPTPTEAEILDTYNKQPNNTPRKIHVRHILIKTDSKDNDTVKKEKKEKIVNLREKLLQGADFAELAKENSDCPSGITRGGDLGTFPRKRMLKAFEDAAFSQKVNEIGPVIKTKFGFHIIQVLKIIEPETKTLEEARDYTIYSYNKSQKAIFKRDLISKLKESAKIDYADEYKPKVK